MIEDAELKRLEGQLERFHGKAWTAKPELNYPLTDHARTPVSYFGPQDAGQEFQLFSTWRPGVHTVRRLMLTDLCPESFQRSELYRFRLCWAKPQLVDKRKWGDVCETGDALYTLIPKKTRIQWNREYRYWITAAWTAAYTRITKQLRTDPKEVSGYDRLCITEHKDMLERALNRPEWLDEVNDFYLNLKDAPP